MKTAAVIAWHNYVPMHDHRFFNVMFDYFIYNFKHYWQDEVDQVYLLDSNWEIDGRWERYREKYGDFQSSKIIVLKTDPNLRYYDTYKTVLSALDADSVLFLDNDMVVYRSGIVSRVWEQLNNFDVVSIYDTIGEKTFEQLGGKSKFCPYWFAAKKKTLMEFRNCEWGPVPWGETLSELTEKMLLMNLKPCEWEEDKNSVYLRDEEIVNDNPPKNLGYYHIRAGSVPAFLLTHLHYGNKDTALEYFANQPKQEIARQLAWYYWMALLAGQPQELTVQILETFDYLGYSNDKLRVEEYLKRMLLYHGLQK